MRNPGFVWMPGIAYVSGWQVRVGFMTTWAQSECSRVVKLRNGRAEITGIASQGALHRQRVC